MADWAFAPIAIDTGEKEGVGIYDAYRTPGSPIIIHGLEPDDGGLAMTVNVYAEQGRIVGVKVYQETFVGYIPGEF